MKGTCEEFYDTWRDIRNIRYMADPKAVPAEEAKKKNAAYKIARDDQYKKQFAKKYSDYFEEMQEKDRLKNFPIKRIIAPFHMVEFGKEHVSPFSILPYKPKTVEEFNNLFYSSQNKKQAATALCVIGFDLLIISAFNVPLILKLTCVGLMSTYAAYTMYERSLEKPCEYTYVPYTLEQIISGIEKFNSSDVYYIRYPNCGRKFSKHSRIMAIENNGEITNER